VTGTRPAPARPTPADLRRARRRRLPDVIGPGLGILFCGINPGLYSTAVGHQFARPGNRFWKALHASGFTDRRFSPFEDALLPSLGLGVTNLCPRTTATADELTAAEIARGARDLLDKVARYRPQLVAVLGIGAYRLAFGRMDAVVGPQPDLIGESEAWVLPNPSGLNAHYGLESLTQHFRALRDHAESRRGRGRRRR
jgi:TDG/mug DNA glycosylase family protein